MSSARQEILLIFPTTIAFIRHQKWGVFYLLREIVQRQKVKVRILMPYHEMTVQTMEDLKKIQTMMLIFVLINKQKML
ncbi:MAG: hypothetical protein WCA61_06590 [Nitrososphaeraceae archaeon]